MKNYIDFLTSEEKIRLCEIITGRYFKEHFKKYEREFSKIQKGFSAKYLSEQRALSIAENNVNKPFISTCINKTVDIWLDKIKKDIENLEDSGLTYDAAVATTMLKSVFVNDVDLYLKLAEKDFDVDARAKIYGKMESIKYERSINAETDARIKTIEEEKNSLLIQIESERHNLGIVREEYEKRIQEIELDNDKLKSMLSDAKERITELQNVAADIPIDDVDYLAKFDDTDTSVLPPVNGDEIVSLCGVISDYNGQKWRIRYADLSHNGQYCIFRKNDDNPPYFLNRNKFFHDDDPSEDGFYGVWNWRTVPNKKDPSKDYVFYNYNMNLDAIEIIVFGEVSSLEELVEMLKCGIECNRHSRRTMFAVYMSKGRYTGILCNNKNLSTVDGKLTFDDSCIEVPIYEFNGADILRLDNGLFFYRNAFAGYPKKLYKLKSQLDIVKNIVLSSISWDTYKVRGLNRTEYNFYRDFMCAIPVEDIICKIATVCRCSDSVAKKLLDEFLDAVSKYIDGDSLEDEIILSAVSASNELQGRTKALIRADWEAENTSLLTEAQKKLNSLNDLLKSATVSLDEAREAYKEIKSEEERLTAIIAEKEKLASDVEIAVAERIQKARKNAADFIADMAFVGGQSTSDAAVKNPDIVESSGNVIYRIVSTLNASNALDIHHSWKDVINTVAFELEEAGVAENYSSGLGAFLCAAYINKQPLLIVGPNAIDIVQAFSAAVTAQKYGILNCEGDYCSQAIAKIGANGESITIINNLFSSGWVNRLPEIISQKEIFYIVVHPYPEDIQVEPKSLYGFMLPLFTEFFVDKTATGKYCGGYFADDFKPYSRSKKDKYKELRILSKLPLTTLVRNRINSLVSTMNCIHPATTADEEFLFAILPIAYASLEMDELRKSIANPQTDIAISASLKHNLRHILGEV